MALGHFSIPVACSTEAAAISRQDIVKLVIEVTTFYHGFARLINQYILPFSIICWLSQKSALWYPCCVGWALRLRLRIFRLQPQAKPRPCSPGFLHGLSTAAFRARILVWKGNAINHSNTCLDIYWADFINGRHSGDYFLNRFAPFLQRFSWRFWCQTIGLISVFPEFNLPCLWALPYSRAVSSKLEACSSVRLGLNLHYLRAISVRLLR